MRLMRVGTAGARARLWTSCTMRASRRRWRHDLCRCAGRSAGVAARVRFCVPLTDVKPAIDEARGILAPIGGAMNGLGGLNKSTGGVVLGVVPLQNPVVATRGWTQTSGQRAVDIGRPAGMATHPIVDQRVPRPGVEGEDRLGVIPDPGEVADATEAV